jgi:hypothetical protein
MWTLNTIVKNHHVIEENAKQCGLFFEEVKYIVYSVREEKCS